MEDICKVVNGVLIPGCWGTAIYGRHACTCKKPSHKELTSRVIELEKRVIELEKAIKQLKGTK